jgi:hypothetical protein
MVLADLGRRLTTAFRDLNGSAPIDEKASLVCSDMADL